MTRNSVLAYIALGSNLEHPVKQIHSALNALRGLPHSTVVTVSKLYQSKPLGPSEQPDYINMVISVETKLLAHELLTELQTIEHTHGRVRTTERWAARTLDLDLILYGNHIISTPLLIVPHPGLLKRNFVLYPLFDIDPTLILPDGTALTDLVSACSTEGLIVIAQVGV